MSIVASGRYVGHRVSDTPRHPVATDGLCTRCHRPLLTKPGPLCDSCTERRQDLWADAQAEAEWEHDRA